ncbi:MAG: membrane-bound lytic murein transglycosylase MltF [Proteobacteria bacterium]|nr:membrane-bound lytic murein transglycosylase MltF [Pseudomonadota bacterium]MBU1638866.1 membrane-bound lytic murein transglycosylase MltF [Pseudomonadota bacterium]
MNKQLLTIFFCLLLVTPGCEQSPDTLAKIQKRGELVVATRNNANCYYQYRGGSVGFEYDLAKAFSEYIGVTLTPKVVEWESLLGAIATDEVHMAAAGLSITKEREKIVDFSDPYLEVQPQIILHRSNMDIESVADLYGQEIHVRQGTTYQQILEDLNEKLPIEIKIVLHHDVPTEELIRQVASREIAITMADSNIALLNQRYHPDIARAFDLGPDHFLAWALKKGDKRFKAKINEFLEYAKENGIYDDIYNRYYDDDHIFDYVDLQVFHRRLQSRLPRYAGMIKREADANNFDWRLITAIIYQESHLDPRALSGTGVRGLMQVTRDTALRMGVKNRIDPNLNVHAGVKYLRQLYGYWSHISEPDRTKFALASYNIGLGHVRDAQKIAKQLKISHDKWSGLQQTLPLLREKKYYKKSKHGYARGTEPVQYVSRIFTYYDILRQKDLDWLPAELAPAQSKKQIMKEPIS